MKFKLYEEFLNESLDKRLERATELAILYTLKQLLPNGGNMYGDWENTDPIFSGDGPDLFINFDEKDAIEFSPEFSTLYNVMDMNHGTIHDEIENKFLEYGLQIEDLSPRENIVHVAIPQLKQRTALRTPNKLSPEDIEFIVNFYNTREEKIKDLETKYKVAIIANKYGL